MKLDVPFLQLPVTFDAAVLAAEIDALGEGAWRPHPQGFPGNDALPLVSVNGDPESDAVRGPMRPTPQLLACPYLLQTMHALGAVWGRSRLMRLSGQAEVTPHVDINYYWREHLRVHVPIVTQPTVRFHCGDAVLNMAAGECWVFDTWRLHRVLNDDSRARVHLVADTIGGRGFWGLMRNAVPHDRRPPGWTPKRIAPDGQAAELDYESVNLPDVMSPWEVREHLGFLLKELPPSQAQHDFGGGLAAPFARDWAALWAKYGDAGGGLDEYRQLRDMLRTQMAHFDGVLMRNGIPLANAVRAIVVTNLVAEGAGGDVEVRDAPGGMVAPAGRGAVVGAAEAAKPSSRNASSFATSAASTGPVPDVTFREPVLLVSSPRSGSTLLFETLAQSPDFVTIGGESHATFESVKALHPSARDFESNRLGAADATPEIIAELRRNFAAELRDRDGNVPASSSTVRLLEKTPKNALRLPFLHEVFPDARYVYLLRQPRQVLSSMMEAWQSGRFRTYPQLPGWRDLSWSLLLVPGWRELQGKPLEEIVARQWATTTNVLLDDLEQVPRERVACIRFEDFVASPQAEMERVAAAVGVRWDRAIDQLPNAKHTVSAPDPDKWKRNKDAIDRVYPLVEAALARAERFFAA